MQNNINNNERDAFSDLFREKLKNHKVPVDAISWDEIESRLKTKNRRIIPFWFRVSGGAAVAALALLFILNPFSEQRSSTLISKSIKIQHEPLQTKHIANYQTQKIIQIQKIQVKQENTDNPKTNDRDEKVVAFNTPSVQESYKESKDSIKTNEVVRNSSKDSENKVTQNTTDNKDTVSHNKRFIPKSLADEPVNEPMTVPRNKNGWLLAASFGANGNVPAANGNYGLTVDANKNISSFVNTASGVTEDAANNFSNITYSPPVSVGLIVRKNLNKIWSLESGLEYTYLLTTFENNQMQRNDAKLHLQYIGVPLNLIAGLWNNSNWEVYLSGGGMLEKGIRSIYENYQYINNQTITTTASTNIEGVQWSVNGSVGINYKIQRNFGIFFEPKISYFFDDNQPTSARTAYPVVIGLMAGIRFQFK